MKTIYLFCLLLIMGALLLMSGREAPVTTYTNYHILQSCGKEAGKELTGMVKIMMQDGWQPTGGVGIVYDDIRYCYCQAMVK